MQTACRQIWSQSLTTRHLSLASIRKEQLAGFKSQKPSRKLLAIAEIPEYTYLFGEGMGVCEYENEKPGTDRVIA